jgi:hypothetical protein
MRLNQFRVLPAMVAVLAFPGLAETPETEFSSNRNIAILNRAMISGPSTASSIAKRTIGKSNVPVTLSDNIYATLCTVTITPGDGEVLIVGHAVLTNSDYNASGGRKNNIASRTAIRILQPDGSHAGVVDGGSGPLVDEVNVLTGGWLTVQPILYDHPKAGVSITDEVAAVTSYHPNYGSGVLIANNYSNPCYISATEFTK